MKNFEDMIIKMEQIDSLLYAMESALLNDSENFDDNKAKKQVHNLFYLLWENFSKLQDDAEELNGHIGVCNAIFAVNRVNELKQEIADLKENLNSGNSENND